MPDILAIIPARGGSKGVPGKNIRPFLGKPLISHAIKAAMGVSRFSGVIVSTDSEEIAAAARQAGGQVPFLRPAELATDSADTVGVVRHGLEWYEATRGRRADYIVLLQPTTPLRDSGDIEGALDLLLAPGEESVIGVYDATHAHPSIMYVEREGRLKPLLEGQGVVRRQEFPRVYVRNGCFYGVTREFFEVHAALVSNNPVGYVMPRWKSVNIDEEHDFALAEFFFSQYGNRDD